MAEEDSGFKVADRRKFTEEGELRDSAKETPGRPASPPGPSGGAQGPGEGR